MGLLVANGSILTLDGTCTVHERGNVHVADGLIRAAGAPRDIAGNDDDILDATDAIVLPGLLNAHTHSPETLARGFVDRICYEDWLGAVWPELDCLTPAQIRVAVLLGCAEMLHGGTTAVVDHFRQTPLTAEAVQAAVDAYRESGMRAAVAMMLRDRAMPPWVKHRGEDPASLCKAILNQHPSNGDLVSIMLAPSAPHRCTDTLLSSVAAMSASRGVHVQMHVDESRTLRQQALDVYGHSSIHHLDELGLLNNRVSLAHCVWVDHEDLDLIAGRDAAVVHNPVSNLRLGNGVAPVPEMLRRGIVVALGSDGAASNDGQNMFEAMKTASLLPGAAGFSDRPLVRDVLAMTTGSIGARFGMRGTGSLEIGRQADLVVLDGADARLHPRNDIHRQIVFAGAGLRVRHVVIAGRIVVRDGKIRTFDEREIFAEADAMILRRR